MSNHQKPSYYAIIPAYVRYADIEPNAKLLYGEITALCESEGYCWATNEYFADLYNVKIRVVQNWLKSLKQIGAIKIDSPSNLQADSQRKIWLSDDCKKMFTERKKMQGGVQKNASTPINSNTTSENPPISPIGDSPPPPKKRMKKSEASITRKSRVWTTESQHNHLLKKANHDASLVDSWYERLEFWKVDKGLEGGNDFKAIGKWVIQAVEEDKNKNPKKIISNDKIEARKQWAKKNEWTAPGGSGQSHPGAYVIISGGQTQTYRYDVDSDFWKERGL